MDKDLKLALDGLNQRLDVIDGRLDQQTKILSDLIEIVTDQGRRSVDVSEKLSVLDAKLDGTATAVALAQLRLEHGGFQRALNQDLTKLAQRTDGLELQLAALQG